MIVYKIDVLNALQESGYTSYRLRKETQMGESAIQKLREGQMIGMTTLGIICDLLNRQPGDIIEYKQ